jgi:BACON domain-containing protein/all-beta uncharacterized protein
MARRTYFVILINLILAIPLAGCGGDDPTEPTPVPCSYTLSPTSRTIGSDGGTGVVTVTTRADCEWSAASGAPWVSISGGSTGKGPGSVSYAVAPNAETSPRTGTISIADLTFSIVEEGRVAPCTYEVTPRQQDFTADGGNGTVNVTAAPACPWTATTSAGWITIASGATGQGNGTVSYTVANHSATVTRTGSITVAGVEVTVAQAGLEPQPPVDCQYSVSPVELTPCMSLPSELTVSVVTQQGCTWNATADSQWITITAGNSGNTSGSVRFRVTDNWDAPRTGIVMVRWPTPTAGQNVRVLQAGCHYAVSYTVFDIVAAGGANSFDVFQQSEPYTCGGALQNACLWTAVSDVPWIVVTSSMPRQGDDRVLFSVAPNTSGAARAGTIRVRDRVVRINQAGLDSWAGLYSVSTFFSPNFSIRYRIWSR